MDDLGQDFTLFAGNDVALRLVITSDGTTPFDLSQVQDIVWSAQPDLSGAPAITKKKSVAGQIDFGAEGGTGTDGVCVVYIAGTDTKDLSGFLFHQAQVKDKDGNLVTVLTGRLRIGPEPAWTYSGDPASSTKDMVRFLIGDTDDKEPLVYDPEILSAIAQRTSVYGAAAMICGSLAARYAREANTSTRDMSDQLSQKSAAYRGMVKDYEAKASISAGASLPLKGLIAPFAS